MKRRGDLFEHLTRRELEVLSLLAANRTNDEIADSLSLSLNSVKWYASQIYGKLGVNNRREAVARATELELLVTSKYSGQDDKSQSLPSGTVTFLFTDIEGSTPLWEKMPKEMAVAVDQHHVILRRAIEHNHGHVTQIIGDAFQAAFRLATDALNAAITAQLALQSTQWGVTGPLKVRMGIHTGHAELDPTGNAPYLVSHTLNRVARIMAAGYGGQILLSQEAKDLLERSLPEEVSIVDLGEHHLKGMEKPEHLYQVNGRGFQSKFPVLSTTIKHPNNLPIQLTSFIGRQKEIVAVSQLLEKNRLVTITGSGGTGKTRLSLQVAGRLLERYHDGVWLVELAPIADGALVIQTIANTLGLQQRGDRDYKTILTGYLKDRAMLLVLDNCEHILEASSRIAYDLLLACPHLTLLATSREGLGISGEVAYRVPSLAVPDLHQLPTLEKARKIEAIRLFTERAGAAMPGFTLAPEDCPAVAQLVTRLDGIPLAIELAAARVGILSIQQIAALMDDRFRLLTGGSRTALPRQRTLRASIDWSYSLLSPTEKALFQRISVFYGGWTLEAAESVCGFGILEKDEILDILASLVNKCLVVAVPAYEGETRYHLLETIRQYAQEKLKENLDDAASVYERHMAFYLNLVCNLEVDLYSRKANVLLKRLDKDLDNLRSAMRWGLEKNNQEGAKQALLIFTALFTVWETRGLFTEACEWGRRGLAIMQAGDYGSAALRVRACFNTATFNRDFFSRKGYYQESINLARQYDMRLDWAKALAFYKADIALYKSLYPIGTLYQNEPIQADDADILTILREKTKDIGILSQYTRAVTFRIIGMRKRIEGDYLQAQALSEEALPIYQEIGTLAGEFHTLNALGMIAIAQHDLSTAEAYFNRAMELATRLNSKYYQNAINMSFGNLFYFSWDFDKGITSFQKAQDYFEERGIEAGIRYALNWKGIALIHLMLSDHAKKIYRDLLSRSQKAQDSYRIMTSLLGLAGVAILSSQFIKAAKLIGFIKANEHNFPRPPDTLFNWFERYNQDWSLQEELSWDYKKLQEQLNPIELTPLLEEGSALSLNDAMGIAQE